MIFIRVDGANIEGIGMGHLYRMIDLSHHILKKKGLSPTFIISGYQETLDALNSTPFKYIEIDNENETNEILEIGQSAKKDTLIMDMCDRDDLFIRKLTEKYFVVSFDDAEGGAKSADMVFNSVVGNLSDREKYYHGAGYFLVRPEISQYNSKKKKTGAVNTLLICLGGSDPCFLNLQMTEWLSGLNFSGKIDWILGPSVKDKDRTIERFKDLNLDITPFIDYKRMGELYYRSDLCICAAGFSLYEIACVGVPAVTVCIYPHQIPTAKKFEEAGVVYNLGFYKEITGAKLKDSLYKLFCDQPRRYSMSEKGKTFVDGLGVGRILAAMENYI